MVLPKTHKDLTLSLRIEFNFLRLYHLTCCRLNLCIQQGDLLLAPLLTLLVPSLGTTAGDTTSSQGANPPPDPQHTPKFVPFPLSHLLPPSVHRLSYL